MTNTSSPPPVSKSYFVKNKSKVAEGRTNKDTVYMYINNTLCVCGEVSCLSCGNIYHRKKDHNVSFPLYHAALIWTTLGQIVNF